MIPSTDPNGNALIFIHIPKTGGLTLRSIIDRNYPPGVVHTISGAPGSQEDFARLPPDSRHQVRMLRGHMSFGLHAHLGRPAKYVTMLRHPVDRVVSLYYFVRHAVENPLHAEVVGGNMTLEDFVESGTPQVTNHQTRILAGREADFTAATLDSARENLAEHFSVVGLSERFDESLVLFRRLVAWRNIRYVKLNVTRDRPTTRQLPPTTLRLIERHNALDMELYEFARLRFEELVRAQGESFKAEVLAFRRSNRVYGMIASARSMARRATPAVIRTLIKRTVQRAAAGSVR